MLSMAPWPRRLRSSVIRGDDIVAAAGDAAQTKSLLQSSTERALFPSQE
jgi:hypothetical protein